MVIHLISSPRTVSTSLMYSFDNRPDTVGIDEPFYAYFLDKTGKEHPGRDQTLNEMPTSVSEICKDLDERIQKTEHLFIKNMGNHLIDLDLHLFSGYVNIFLIRNPRPIIASFGKLIKHLSLFDIGVKEQWLAHNKLKKIGAKVYVIDSIDILKNPEYMLRALCDRIGIAFSERMLSWAPGPRPIDGSWARYWYDTTHQSTGFIPYTEKPVHLDASYESLNAEAQIYYNKLRQLIIQ